MSIPQQLLSLGYLSLSFLEERGRSKSHVCYALKTNLYRIVDSIVGEILLGKVV